MEQEKKIWKLSNITSAIESILKKSPGNKSFLIRAEISSVNIYPEKKTCYLELVEKAIGRNDTIAEIRAIIWSNSFQIIESFESKTGEKFKAGLEIAFHATLNYQSKYGLSLFITSLHEEYTLGNVALAKARVLGSLIQNYTTRIFPYKGYYVTPNKNLKLPLAIKNIALIAAKSSEGRKDFMTSLIQNKYGLTFRITTFRINVQGLNAEQSMCHALKMINETDRKFDVAVIVRGGGSPTSFMPFNSYELAEKIAFSKIPIITGIGHATDNSVADMMANTMTTTPTKAAEFIVSHNFDVLKKLRDLKTNIIHEVKLTIKNTHTEFSEEKINIYQNTKKYTKVIRQKLTVEKKSIKKNIKQLLSIKQKGLSNTKIVITHQTKDIVNDSRRRIDTHKNIISNNCKILFNDFTIKLKNTSNKVSNQTQSKISRYKIDLHGEKTKVSNKFKSYLLAYKADLDKYRQQVRLLDQSNLFSRGYALLYKDGKIITNHKMINPNDIIETRLKNIYIKSKVISKNKKNEK